MDFAAAHGGPDAQGAPRWDFSTNANACGPAPVALRAVLDADPTRYPDPASTALRASLAALHGVPARRIVIAASASEFIARLTAAVARRWPGAAVHVPSPGYGDYARAALAWGLLVASQGEGARLVWHTEPGSPRGDSSEPPQALHDAVSVVDAAYAPLQLEAEPAAWPAHAWRLMSPNKALGLTGVRGAYAVAPEGADDWLQAIEQLAPSWPLGAQGVAMLQAWACDDSQQWVKRSLATLREWKRQQLDVCRGLGWECAPSVTPFYVARWADAPFADTLAGLRMQGVKLRDATLMGLPGWVRLSVQPPEAQQALAQAWRAVTGGARKASA